MILERDAEMLVAVAASRVNVRLDDLALSVLGPVVVKACQYAGRDLDPDKLTEIVVDLRFDEAMVKKARYDFVAIGAMFRSQETGRWVGECDFLIRVFQEMVMNAEQAGIGTTVLRGMSTVYVLVGYAIRIGRGTTVA
jgi:hypothetical protein